MTEWSETRCARLGYLVGIGWDAARICRDPSIRCEVRDIHRQVRRLGLTFREPVQGSPLNLAGDRMAFFDAAARKRRLPTEALLRKLCERIEDETTIDSLLATGTAG